MSGMHQPVTQETFIGNNVDEPILHEIDYHDVALSKEATRMVHHGARAVLRQIMPAADTDNLTASQAVALFIDKLFWEENSGGLIMCIDMSERSYCLPIPSTHWKVRGSEGPVQ
ncbi:hypothetical protein [Pseudodesulfovibrio sp. zrk46]|uniref:hypothetical protein n=1 Tax=Pseudodesulfovibrio sp. zrk46 TaxID=2725288 RepID=UPI0014496E06|nr:hypothetical protein [Pseudodesulfovibrio sp. zrk46]QJB55124.1 hypothetical protein HFN16_01320 [Pseudodesulfovibrio sp. zrk46]